MLGLGVEPPDISQTRPWVGHEADTEEAVDDVGSSDVKMVEVVVVTLAVVEADVDSSVNELVTEVVAEAVVSVVVEAIDTSLLETAIEDVSRIDVLVVNVEEDRAKDGPGLQTSASQPKAAKATAKPTIVLKDISTSKS